MARHFDLARLLIEKEEVNSADIRQALDISQSQAHHLIKQAERAGIAEFVGYKRQHLFYKLHSSIVPAAARLDSTITEQTKAVIEQIKNGASENV